MSRLVALVAWAAGLASIPVVVILAALAVVTGAVACPPGAPALRADAPVWAPAREWVATVRAACPELPTAWVAAVMAQESAFRPDAHAEDRNGGTRGLLQLNQAVWANAYGAPWSADRNQDGIWDVNDPAIHAQVGGQYLCQRLDTVRQLRNRHPEWASTRELTELDALVVAHNAGEAALAVYPALPTITADYLHDVRERVASWSPPDGQVLCGTRPALTLPAGTAPDTAAAVRTSLAYVGLRSGWYRRCDALACRAYGYQNSGYPTATVHWFTLLAANRAHPGDRCPPVGAFMFWQTSQVAGHVALVVANDGSCRPEGIRLVTNDWGDTQSRTRGGVYLVTLAQIENGWMSRAGYRGWTDPVCAGALLPNQTQHPAP
jgi:Transglycosylase SLT domain